MGQRVELPLFPFVSGEKSYFGSFWGNHNDLHEVLALASQGLIKHNVVPVKLDDINENLEALGRGDIVGPRRRRLRLTVMADIVVHPRAVDLAYGVAAVDRVFRLPRSPRDRPAVARRSGDHRCHPRQTLALKLDSESSS